MFTCEWNKIVLFRPSRIGDTLVTFPLIEGLYRLYPNTPLVYCSQRYSSKEKEKTVQGYDVAKLSPRITEIVTYCFENSKIEKYWELKQKLNIDKNDLLIYLPYNTVQRQHVIRDWIFFKALGYKHMIGFKETWDWTYLYEKKNDLLPKEADRILDTVRLAGIPVESPASCAVTCDVNWVEQKWDEWEIRGKKVLAVCPCTNMQSKQWPIERYIEVGIEWNRQTGMPLVIVGGPGDAATANEIVSHWPGYGFSACGASLGQTAAVLSRAQAYCGNDTGCMHLAAILGIPCIAIFSSRAPAELWYPLGENNHILMEDIECKNCNLWDCHTIPPLCLDRISARKVIDALKNKLMCRLEILF